MQSGSYTREPDGSFSPSIPEPFSWGLISWLWKRITGWHDAYGRPAQLMKFGE